jgi:hypothetical protein
VSRKHRRTYFWIAEHTDIFGIGLKCEITDPFDQAEPGLQQVFTYALNIPDFVCAVNAIIFTRKRTLGTNTSVLFNCVFNIGSVYINQAIAVTNIAISNVFDIQARIGGIRNIPRYIGIQTFVTDGVHYGKFIPVNGITGQIFPCDWRTATRDNTDSNKRHQNWQTCSFHLRPRNLSSSIVHKETSALHGRLG